MIIADTGAWVGLANRRDTYHEACRRFFRSNQEPLITTGPVLVESIHLLYRYIGVDLTLSWFETIQRQGIRVFSLQASYLGRISILMRRYRNLPMDLADASLVLLAEETGSGRIVSTDQRDFNAYRWKNQEPFSNLLHAKGVS